MNPINKIILRTGMGLIAPILALCCYLSPAFAEPAIYSKMGEAWPQVEVAAKDGLEPQGNWRGPYSVLAVGKDPEKWAASLSGDVIISSANTWALNVAISAYTTGRELWLYGDSSGWWIIHSEY